MLDALRRREAILETAIAALDDIDPSLIVSFGRHIDAEAYFDSDIGPLLYAIEPNRQRSAASATDV